MSLAIQPTIQPNLTFGGSTIGQVYTGKDKINSRQNVSFTGVKKVLNFGALGYELWSYGWAAAGLGVAILMHTHVVNAEHAFAPLQELIAKNTGVEVGPSLVAYLYSAFEAGKGLLCRLTRKGLLGEKRS